MSRQIEFSGTKRTHDKPDDHHFRGSIPQGRETRLVELKGARLLVESDDAALLLAGEDRFHAGMVATEPYEVSPAESAAFVGVYRMMQSAPAYLARLREAQAAEARRREQQEHVESWIAAFRADVAKAKRRASRDDTAGWNESCNAWEGGER
jgi:hypothetical protein